MAVAVVVVAGHGREGWMDWRYIFLVVAFADLCHAVRRLETMVRILLLLLLLYIATIIDSGWP